MIEEALRSIILADTTVSGLIGTRFYPVEFPQNCQKPAAIYIPISDPDKGSHHWYEVQIVVHAVSFSQAKTVLEAIKQALKDFDSGIKDNTHIFGFYFPGILGNSADPSVPLYEQSDIIQLDYAEV